MRGLSFRLLLRQIDDRDEHKRASIFSISVHPDGSRIATGGLDAKIRLWSTSPILSAKSEQKGHPTSLATLTTHSGPVLCVRWAASGKWLASGSDDTLVMIWDLDPKGGGKVWGTDESNREGWKALRTLKAHESDVTDLAWAPGDRYLASVGLDSKVYIWCGLTLDLVRHLDFHQGFVKGVCWDPVGEFLATQSDDRSVKIWRSTDWGLEASIEGPFKDSPTSTFFSRLSWSPDGSYITAANAMNSGAVFVAAVIERDKWSESAPISLVGHENTVQVAAYNPRLFYAPPEDEDGKLTPARPLASDLAPENVCSVVALGADDCSISIWRTSLPRPVIVAKDAFDRQILDLAWSGDGRTLWACSSDGTIGVLDFWPAASLGSGGGSLSAGFVTVDQSGVVDPAVKAKPKPDDWAGEMEGIQSVEVSREYVKGLYEFDWPPPLEKNRIDIQNQWTSGYPSGPSHHYRSNSSYGPPPGTPGFHNHHASAHQSYSIPIHTQTPPKVIHPPPPPNQAQKVTIMKNGKKRIQPTFLGGGGGFASPTVGMPPPPQPQQSQPPPIFGPSTHGGSAAHSYDGGMDWVPTERFDPRHPPSRNHSGPHGQRHSQSYHSHSHRDIYNGPPPGSSSVPVIGMGYRIPEGGRIPGHGESRVLQALPPPPAIGVSSPRMQRPGSRGSIGGGVLPGLEMPPILSEIFAGEKGRVVVEARNSEDGSTSTEIICALGADVHWIDYVSRRVVGITKTSMFAAIAMDDGSLNLYSPHGRRLSPTISLEAPAAILKGSGKYLLVITTTGIVNIWDTQTLKTKIASASIAPQFNLPNVGALSKTVLSENGSPVLAFSGGTTLGWSEGLQAWVRIHEAWWREGSDIDAAPEQNDGKPKAFRAALTLGHLETRIAASLMVGSGEQWRGTVVDYARRLGEERYVERAEELIRELAGPVFWDPDNPDLKQTTWEPTALGISKRELLQKEVLPLLAATSDETMQRKATEWIATLRKMEEQRYAVHRGF